LVSITPEPSEEESPMSDAVKTVFEEMKKRFKPNAVDKKTTFYFSLGENAGEKWTLTLSPTECEIVEGKAENADVFLKTSADLFVKIMTGKHKPGMSDFMMGRIKSNDPMKLKLLEQAFGPAK
jgi:long-chain acyl-CoA synthetase